ncbi:MAG: DegV family protein [Actinomycetota bacterium]
MTVGLVTDSASQIPAGLAERLGAIVVPVVVTIDGVDHREGVDLTADAFWDALTGHGLPEVGTSQPSPGELVAAYEAAISAGAEEIVSVHVGADVSGTVNAATLAADLVDVPVHVVDSGTASFGVAACLWEAALHIERGGDAAGAAAAAAAMAPMIGTSFILQGLDFALAGGRLAAALPDDADEVMVLAGHGTDVQLVGTSRDLDELADMIVAPYLAAGTPIRAAVGLADAATAPITERIEARLRASELVVDLVRYRVGPSIAAHTGPGTAGGFWWPAER